MIQRIVFLTLLTLWATLPHTATAESGSNLAQEPELQACLVLEQEGLQRFAALEARANELRGVDALLKGRREALLKTKQGMDNKKPSDKAVNAFNNEVNVFNQQTDQLNADKAAFEADKMAYEAWLASALKPTCNKLNGKPVAPITAFYACGYDKTDSNLLQVPYCKNLGNLAELKACASKAGSKTAAYSACMNF
ncbi:MAG TPA: hypothetical protein VFV57_02575 [Limnobacter sp.]|nr:hypothetical protein [Limnobacter sp.]